MVEELLGALAVAAPRVRGEEHERRDGEAGRVGAGGREAPARPRRVRRRELRGDDAWAGKERFKFASI